MKCLIIFVKYPVAGKVKTRLGAQIGHKVAADLYQIFIDFTLNLAHKTSAQRIFIAYEPENRKNDFRELLTQPCYFFPQKGEDLGKRMLNSIEHALNEGFSKIVILGSDSPTLPPQILEDAFHRLDSWDLVLGPSEDGGYYLIGVKAAHKEIFDNILWSSSTVLRVTLERARAMGLASILLPTWYDVDNLDDLKRAIKDDLSGKIKACLRKHKKTLSIIDLS